MIDLNTTPLDVLRAAVASYDDHDWYGPETHRDPLIDAFIDDARRMIERAETNDKLASMKATLIRRKCEAIQVAHMTPDPVTAAFELGIGCAIEQILSELTTGEDSRIHADSSASCRDTAASLVNLS